MAVFMIDKRHMAASVVALIAAVLTFFGFIHGPAIGIAVTPMVALSYLLVAGVFFGFTRLENEPQPAS